MQFTKFDAALHEAGPHLRPSEVAADVPAAAERLRCGGGLTPAALSVEIQANNENYLRQFKAVCRLARVSAVPLITTAAAPAGSSIEAEVKRSTRLTGMAGSEGVQLAVATCIGTLTEDPDVAVDLCERVPDLGVTLDPSHYLAGPYSAKSYDGLFPYVRHVQLRDTRARSESIPGARRTGRDGIRPHRGAIAALQLQSPLVGGHSRRDRRAVCHAAGSAKTQISAGKPGLIDRDVFVGAPLD